MAARGTMPKRAGQDERVVTRTGLVATVVLAGVVGPGCGGETDQPPSPPRPAAPASGEIRTEPGEAPTKPAFLKEADAVCAEAKRRAAPITAAAEAMVASEDAAGVAAELRKGLPIAEDFLGTMRALTPPKGDEAVVGRYLAIVADQMRRIPPLVEALEAEDISTIEVLVAELREGNDRARRLALLYGFRKCGPQGLPTG